MNRGAGGQMPAIMGTGVYPRRRWLKRLTRYFFQGVLVSAPIAITGYVFYILSVWIGRPLDGLLMRYLGLRAPGIGFVLTVILATIFLTLAGFLSSFFLARSALEVLERYVDKFPLAKILYSATKDFVGAFVGDNKRFDRPVLVTLVPGSNVKVVGFITRATMEAWGLADDMAVYLPMAYNFAGNLVIVPKSQVQPLETPSGDVMAFVVSGGVAGIEAPSARPEETARRTGG